MPKVSIFWFRRDLRLADNAALLSALESGHPVQPVFIFDREILDELNDKRDARVSFIHQEITRLSWEIHERGGHLDVRYGKPKEVWKDLVAEYDVASIYANRDYEPYARERDKAIYDYLEGRGIPFVSKKDHVIFEKSEVLKADGAPYVVYTPYSRCGKSAINGKVSLVMPPKKSIIGIQDLQSQSPLTRWDFNPPRSHFQIECQT